MLLIGNSGNYISVHHLQDPLPSGCLRELLVPLHRLLRIEILFPFYVQIFVHQNFHYLLLSALRELFGAKAGNYSSEFLSREWTRDIGLAHSDKDIIKTEFQSLEEVKKIEEVDLMEDEVEKPGRASLKGMHDSADEFFDVPEPTEYDQFENEWPSELSMEQHSTVPSLLITETDLLYIYIPD